MKVYQRLILITALVTEFSWADPFTNAPTPKAAAMGGAYTAFSNDAASVWYNPAGLVGSFNDSSSNSPITFDLTTGSTTQLAANGDLSQSDNTLFIGGKFSNDDYAFGLYYYQPHRIDFTLAHQPNNLLWGEIKQSIHALSIPLAISYLDGRVKLGASIELVSLYANDTKINTSDEYDWPQTYVLNEDEASSYSGSLATQITLLDNTLKDMKVLFGAVYRFSAHSDANLESGDDVIDTLLMKKPESYDIGLSWHKSLMGNQNITIAAQLGETTWNEENSYQKLSIGSEFKFPQKNWATRQLRYQTAIQLGYYSSTAKLSNTLLQWPDTSGASLGLTFDIGTKYTIALAAEQRTTTSQTNVKNTANFFTLGVTWKRGRL